MNTQEEKSSVNTPIIGIGISNQALPGAGLTLPALDQRLRRSNSRPPITDGFRNLRPAPKFVPTWSDQVDRAQREQTKSAADIIVSTVNTEIDIDVNAAAIAAASKAEALRLEAEKASRDAVFLKKLAEANDSVVLNDNVVLVREYTDCSNKEEKAMPSLEFANILANLDQLSVKQLKIISSAVTALLPLQALPVPALQPAQYNTGLIGNQPIAPQAVSYANVAAKQPPTSNRSRGNSRVRANPVQGGVRTNQRGGRIDYDNRVYTDPTGKRFRMQTPRQKSGDRLKAETQIQTVVRRLKSFADTNGISKDCQPVAGSDLESTFKGLLNELSSSKQHLKDVKAKSKPKKFG